MVSRPYASVLLGFGFVALQARRPERFRPWVLLGPLANTTVFGTNWSFALGLFYAYAIGKSGGSFCPVRRSTPPLPPLPSPAQDFTFGRQASAEFNQFDMPLHFAIGAFVPFFSPFVGDVLHKFGGAAADLAASPSSRTRSVSCYRFLAAARAICCSRRPCSLCRSSPYSPGKLKFSTLRYILR